MQAAREYVLGTDAQEVARLGLQHGLWADAARGLWARAGLGAGQVALDIGCGPGFGGLEMAERVGASGRVVGIDESAPFVAHANEQARARGLGQFSALEGDVQDMAGRWPPGAPPADFAYARWVLCFVRDPAAVLDGAAAILRPGGRIALQDYYNYGAIRMAPDRESFARVRAAIVESWRGRGGDPDVMGRAPGLLRARGFEIESMRVEQRVARPGDAMWAWPDSFWRSFVPRLVAQGLLREEDGAAFRADWAEASGDPASFIHLPPVYEVVAVRGKAAPRL